MIHWQVINLNNINLFLVEDIEAVVEGHPEMVKKNKVRSQYSGNDVVFKTNEKI